MQWQNDGDARAYAPDSAQETRSTDQWPSEHGTGASSEARSQAVANPPTCGDATRRRCPVRVRPDSTGPRIPAVAWDRTLGFLNGRVRHTEVTHRRICPASSGCAQEIRA